MSKFRIEDSPITPFLIRLFLTCSGGFLIDGYMLVIIGPVLVQLAPLLQLDAHWKGLAGAASLAGLFLGAVFFGGLSDRIGRRLTYILDLTALAVLSLLHIFVTTATELVVLRFITGIAIGANYPIATSLVAEFSPMKYRHIFVSGIGVQWFVGAMFAGIVGYFFIDVPGGWKWMLALGVVPIILVFMLRTIPESPSWLLSRNRVEEARRILKKCYGPEADVDSMDQTVEVKSAGFSKLLEPLYLKRIFFVGGFFFCLVLPLFAIYTFAPMILEMMGLGHGKEVMLGDMLINAVFLIGSICATFWANTFGRRPLVIWSFVIMTIGMLVLTLFPSGPIWIILVGFALYAFSSGGPNVLPWLYTSELFPTEVRASAVGINVAISRVGACIGTYLLPIWLETYGVGTTMAIMTGITAVGLIISIALAPETKGLTLEQAAGSIDRKSS